VPPEARLAELGVQLPAPQTRLGLFDAVAITGTLAFVSGHIPFIDGQVVRGTLGADLDVAAGQEAARAATLGCLSSLRDALDTLDRIVRVVKVVAFVRATPEFTEQPLVANGCSVLLGEIFGTIGRHARSAIGVASLPLGAAVEVEMVVEIEQTLAIAS